MINNISKHSLFIVLLIHLVGIIGILSPFRSFFLILTPFNLLISFILVAASFPNKEKNFLYFCILCYVIGLLIEIIGVNTGAIFGTYQYGTALGIKVFNTPLLIGINWLVLSLSIASLIDSLNTHRILKIILASILMVLLDLLIEPVAIELNFWHWENNLIPLMNYIAWFLVSLVIFTMYFYLKIERSTGIANYFYPIQLIFFSILNLFT